MKVQFRTFFLVLFLIALTVQAKQIIKIKPTVSDMTLVVREAIENATDPDIKLEFSKGTYHFSPQYAVNKYYPITNHDNGFKSVVFQFENINSIEIEGNGSNFIFHGRMAPFIFENCNKVSINDLSIDWDIPFTFQGEIVGYNKTEKWREIKPTNEGFSWKVRKNKLLFPNIDGYSFSELGHTYTFDPQTKDVVYGVKGSHSNPNKIEKLPNGNLRIHEKLNFYPPIGSIQSSSGINPVRYAPGIYVKASKNITIDNVKIYHALGMGFLFERANTITLKNSGVHLSEGSNRVVSSKADATHFCNCKGDILVENCRFENMLDDGTNVHGTYVFVDKILDEKRIRIEVRHHQQKGFLFAEKADEIWFIHKPNPHRGGTNKVALFKVMNETYAEITFENPLPKHLKIGDVLENKTWNPTFTMRGCSIGNHRARNIVLKTPLKTVIENNRFFSSDMASILFRGENFKWYESGSVKDVLIKNNYFSYCTHGASDQPVLYISPKIEKSFHQNTYFDENIRFINNTIETFDNRIVIAERVKGLVIKGNTIKQTATEKPLHPNAPMMELNNCVNSKIIGNTYEGDNIRSVKADKKSKETLEMINNMGFKNN